MSEFKFNIGDIVKVVDVGQCYNHYHSFFHMNEEALRKQLGDDFLGVVAMWTHGKRLPKEYEGIEKFKVIGYAEHEDYNIGLYVISRLSEDDGYLSDVYIIGKSGIEFYEPKKMTVEEIEKILGYEIQIVKE